MPELEQQVKRFASELKKADRDAYIQWVVLTYEIPNDAHSALFYIETGKIDIEFVKCKLMDVTEAEEIELYPDYSMEVVNPKVFLEKLDVDVSVYHDSERAKEPVIVPLVLSEYSINFTDYSDGIGGYLKTEFVDGGNKVVTGWIDYSGNAQKMESIKALLLKFGATEIVS